MSFKNERALPNKLAALQQQRWDGDTYTGFRCPSQCKICPLKAADHLDDDDALEALRGKFELHHTDGARKSKTGTSFPEQLQMLCKDCHDLEHFDDPSASRYPRKKI